MRLGLLLLCLFGFCILTYSQTGDSITLKQKTNASYNNITSNSLNYLTHKYNRLNGLIQKHTQKVLQTMQNREVKLQEKMQGIDSAKASDLFAHTQEEYQAFQAKLASPLTTKLLHPLQEYIPTLDSIQTGMQFLAQLQNKLPADKLAQVEILSEGVRQLAGRLQQANEVQDFIRKREAALQSQLSQYGLGKQLLGINKQVYYYQQQLQQYKELIKDKKVLEQKALFAITQLPAFQDFMTKHSYLALLFPMPAGYGTTQALAGLQTRTQIQRILTQSIGAGGGSMNPEQYLQQQLQNAQTQLSRLKNKASQLGLGSGSSEMTMPDFKPDNQKTKSFFQRLEYGINIQSDRGTSLLPVTSDLALTLGYKISDRATVGTGLAYKLGWGTGWNHIALSSQGVGLRSYLDIKAKGSIWITGGFEYNYYNAFASLHDLENIPVDAWQKSALAGITKKYKIGKREGNMQLLYDFLANTEVPRGQVLKFRVGWNF